MKSCWPTFSTSKQEEARECGWTPSRRAPGRSLVRSSLYQDHSPGLSPRWRRISDPTWCRRRAFRRCWVDLWRGSRRFRGKGIWAPRTVRSLGIRPLGGLAGRSLSGCTTRTKCLGRRVLRSFCCDVWASSVQRTVSRETAELHAAAQVSLAIPRHVRRTAHQKGFLWGFREVGVALIPLTCVTAPGSPRLSSLSV